MNRRALLLSLLGSVSAPVVGRALPLPKPAPETAAAVAFRARVARGGTVRMTDCIRLNAPLMVPAGTTIIGPGVILAGPAFSVGRAA